MTTSRTSKKTTAKKPTSTKKAASKRAPAKATATKKTAAKKSAAKKSAGKATKTTSKAAPRKTAAKKPAQSPNKQFADSAAFFDLDRTLIRGSANFPLALAAFRAGFVPKRQLAKDIVNAVVFVVAGASDERSAKVRERILGAVAGAPVKDIVSLGDAFIPHLAETVMPESRAELDRMKAEGRDRIIVSASPTEIVEALAAELGLEGAVGTQAEVKDGKYTGKLAGPFCYGPGKVEAIEKLARERGYDLSKSVAYSDSISDLPFMNAVGQAVAINADNALVNYAIDHGWRIVETREDTARVAEAALDLRKASEELAAALGALALSRGNQAQGKLNASRERLNQRAEDAIASAQEQLAKSATLIGSVTERLPGL